MSKGEQALSTSLPDNPDGFRIALDTSRERADIVLQRPPLNVVAMPQREQLRQTFEALEFGVIALESVLNCVWPATFVCAARQHCLHCLNSESRRYPDLVDRYVCCT